MGFKMLIGVMLLFLGCIKQNHSEMKSVFGTDNRKTLSNDNPFQEVLKVKEVNGGTCSAFMVGPRIVLSAGHCTVGLQDGSTLTATFHRILRNICGAQIHQTHGHHDLQRKSVKIHSGQQPLR